MKVRAFLMGLGAMAGTALASGMEWTSGLIVLDRTGAEALSLVGNAAVEIPTHAVYVNSSSGQAVRTQGSALLDTPNLYVVGSATFNGQSSCTGNIVMGAVPCDDPLSGLTFPTPGGMTPIAAQTLSGGTHTLSPGFYAGGISISGNADVTLNPGTYLIGGSGFRLTSGRLIGQGVAIVMHSGAFDVAGGSQIHLAPLGTGDLGMVAIAQPPSNTNLLRLRGNAETIVVGAIYAPSATIDLSGTSTVANTGPLMGDLVIGHRVAISGTAQLRIGRVDMHAIVPPRLPLAD